MKIFSAYVRVLLDRAFGALVGQRCDLCREWTTCRVEDEQGCITWCPPCAASEFRRHGL
jgi:hypothetical protein